MNKSDLILFSEDDKPARLDLPIWRHLTWSEVHAFQWGIGLGVLGVLSWRQGEVGALLGILTLLINKTVGRQNERTNKTSCSHPMALDDVKKDPEYTISGAVITGVIILFLL